jgi:membrane fusion protein, multidrug efflux system
MNNTRPAYVYFCLIVLLSFTACGNPGSRNPDGNASASAEETAAADPVPVEVRTVESGSIAEYIETTGNIYAESRVVIYPKTSGQIMQVNVEEGDAVSKGQVLAVMDDDELRLRAQQLDISRRQAKEKRDRAKELFESRMISREAFDDANYRYEDTDVALKLARLNLDNTRIQSPIDGIIVARNVRTGDLVTVSTPVFDIIDPKSLLIDVYLPERESSRLQPGMPVEITPDSLPGTSFAASVLRINPTVDPGTGTVKVTLDFKSDISRLSAGMFVRAKIKVDSRDAAVILPKRALIRQRDQNRVFVVNDAGQAEERSLVLGLENMHSYEVLSGLDAGEKLIVVGQHIIESGQPVTWHGSETPAQTPPETDDEAGV